MISCLPSINIGGELRWTFIRRCFFSNLDTTHAPQRSCSCLTHWPFNYWRHDGACLSLLTDASSCTRSFLPVVKQRRSAKSIVGEEKEFFFVFPFRRFFLLSRLMSLNWFKSHNWSRVSRLYKQRSCTYAIHGVCNYTALMNGLGWLASECKIIIMTSRNHNTRRNCKRSPGRNRVTSVAQVYTQKWSFQKTQKHFLISAQHGKITRCWTEGCIVQYSYIMIYMTYSALFWYIFCFIYSPVYLDSRERHN